MTVSRLRFIRTEALGDEIELSLLFDGFEVREFFIPNVETSSDIAALLRQLAQKIEENSKE